MGKSRIHIFSFIKKNSLCRGLHVSNLKIKICVKGEWTKVVLCRVKGVDY